MLEKKQTHICTVLSATFGGMLRDEAEHVPSSMLSQQEQNTPKTPAHRLMWQLCNMNMQKIAEPHDLEEHLSF